MTAAPAPANLEMHRARMLSCVLVESYDDDAEPGSLARPVTEAASIIARIRTVGDAFTRVIARFCAAYRSSGLY